MTNLRRRIFWGILQQILESWVHTIITFALLFLEIKKWASAHSHIAFSNIPPSSVEASMLLQSEIHCLATSNTFNWVYFQISSLWPMYFPFLLRTIWHSTTFIHQVSWNESSSKTGLKSSLNSLNWAACWPTDIQDASCTEASFGKARGPTGGGGADWRQRDETSVRRDPTGSYS